MSLLDTLSITLFLEMSDDAAEGHGDTYVSTGERTPAVMNVRRFVINMKDLANVFAAG